MSDLLTRVHRLMDQNDIKPTQLAKTLGLSTSSFTDWGKGKGSPSLKAVIQIAEYFDVSIDYLVYGKKEATPAILEISNPEDTALLDKFHLLTPELRRQVIGYIDGMVSAMPKPASKEEQRLLG